MTPRSILVGLSFLSLSACETGPYAPSPPTADEQRRLAALIGDRTAGPPERCISASSGMQLEAIGDQIVARWGGRVWVNRTEGSCRLADSSSAYLLTNSLPTGQYCENETFKVVASSSGMIMGSCFLGPWVPYTR